MYGVAGVMALLSSGQVVDKQRERKTTLYLETRVCTVYSVGLFCVFQAALLKLLNRVYCFITSVPLSWYVSQLWARVAHQCGRGGQGFL